MESTLNGKNSRKSGKLFPFVNLKLYRYTLSFQTCNCLPDRLAQSAGHLTRKSEVLDSIPDLALSFLLPLIQEGQLSVTGESMCTKYCTG